VGGVPAKLIKKRFDEETIALLERLQWWNKSKAEIKQLIPLLMSMDKNSFESICSKPDDFLIFGAFCDNELVGYCIFEPVSGDVTQIAVDGRHRRKGLGTSLLAEALKFNRHDSLKIVNTDVGCDSIIRFLESVNIPLTGKQFEMIRKL
jgi:ribosomal protein S18 acetylase RimI-like enzyme